jgi:hypothetical protein
MSVDVVFVNASFKINRCNRRMLVAVVGRISSKRREHGTPAPVITFHTQVVYLLFFFSELLFHLLFFVFNSVCIIC